MSAKLSHCPKCGTEVAPDAKNCTTCGEPLADNSANATPLRSDAAGVRRRVAYAGFWLRAVAYTLDSFILSITLSVILRPILESNHVGPSVRDVWAFYTSYTRQSVGFVLLIQLADWLYSAGLESSAWQATLGKRMLSLQVTDLAGRRLTFARATGRHFGKYVSSLSLFLGFLMAGFTERKQAMHDVIAGCLVVRKA